MGSRSEWAEEGSPTLIGIYEISKVLASTLDLEKSLHDVVNILSSFLDLRRGVVVLKDPDDELELAAVTGMSLKMARSGQLKYPVSIAAKVISSGLPLVIADAASEPELADFLDDSADLEDEAVSFVCIPIRTTDRAFGSLSVLKVWPAEGPRIIQHDLRSLSMIATLIGQTVSLHRKVVADRQQLLADNARLHKRMAEIGAPVATAGLKDVIGTSPAMERVFSQVGQAAPTKATVLLRGESGTGKELVAQAIHALSPRAAKPFIKVNCAALAESVLESELFGHEKGSFTGALAERKGRFELANGGTLFLDEIGEISSAFQAKLLRVLQEGEFERVGGIKTIKVDVRLVAATNRDLEKAVKENSFRADLYYRLNVVPIFLPPLRERAEDIGPLAQHFLDRFNAENNRSVTLSPNALLAFKRCSFPGNVRELENCVYRSATMAKTDVIEEMELACRRDVCLSATLWNGTLPAIQVAAPSPTPMPPSPIPAASEPAAAPASASSGEPLSERDRLVEAMEKCGWVQAKAARMLGLTPRQIGYALKKHGIELRQL